MGAEDKKAGTVFHEDSNVAIIEFCGGIDTPHFGCKSKETLLIGVSPKGNLRLISEGEAELSGNIGKFKYDFTLRKIVPIEIIIQEAAGTNQSLNSSMNNYVGGNNNG